MSRDTRRVEIRGAGDHAEEFCGHVVHEAEMILHFPGSPP